MVVVQVFGGIIQMKCTMTIQMMMQQPCLCRHRCHGVRHHHPQLPMVEDGMAVHGNVVLFAGDDSTPTVTTMTKV